MYLRGQSQFVARRRGDFSSKSMWRDSGPDTFVEQLQPPRVRVWTVHESDRASIF
jgi:hypothetical protein